MAASGGAVVAVAVVADLAAVVVDVGEVQILATAPALDHSPLQPLQTWWMRELGKLIRSRGARTLAGCGGDVSTL